MKLSTGRGIQFFKKPIFSAPKTFVVNTFNRGKKHVSNAVTAVGKPFAGQRNKNKKKKAS